MQHKCKSKYFKYHAHTMIVHNFNLLFKQCNLDFSLSLCLFTDFVLINATVIIVWVVQCYYTDSFILNTVKDKSILILGAIIS